MRSRLILSILSLGLIVGSFGCTKKSPLDSSNAASDSGSANAPANPNTPANASNVPAAEAPKPPLVVPSGTAVTIRLGSALGSKLSQPGETFTGAVAKDVVVDNTVAIPRGASVTGTVVDAKALGRFAGGAVLEIRLTSVNVNGSDLPIHASARSFTIKGKGKRTGIMAGGGAALGGIIGGLAGGGKGAAIGLAAGGGAGGAGAAFTGNKEIVLPAESTISFELRKPVEISQ